MNLCVSCGEDFASVKAFDYHRVGTHAYRYSEGLQFDPPVEDGRRCLYISEMLEGDFVRDKYGRWSVLSDRVRVREHHQRRAESDATDVCSFNEGASLGRTG